MAVRKLFEKLAKAIKWEHIDDSAVRTNNVQNKAITEPKYADGSVSERALMNQSVTEPKLASGAGSTRVLANGSVTPDKLSPEARSKESYGLGNVDNTSDVDKPVSTATANALAGKEPKLPEGATDQYLRGDRTFRRLSSLAVLGTVDETATLNTTAPGVFAFRGTSGIPAGASSPGTLYVTSTDGQDGSNRAQLYVDTYGYAFARGFYNNAFHTWKALTAAANPYFFGAVTQTHGTKSTERVQYQDQGSRGITNSSGELRITRAGKYRVQVTSSGGWVEAVTGFGRGLKIQQNGADRTFSETDAPIVLGNGVGAFTLTGQALLTCNANDTITATFEHGTTGQIRVRHSIEVMWVE